MDAAAKTCHGHCLNKKKKTWGKGIKKKATSGKKRKKEDAALGVGVRRLGPDLDADVDYKIPDDFLSILDSTRTKKTTSRLICLSISTPISPLYVF